MCVCARASVCLCVCARIYMYELKCVPMYPSGDRAISCMYTCVLPVYLFSQPLICLSIYLFVHARMLAGMLASMNACTHIHHNLCGGCRCKVRRRIFKYIHRRTCIDPVLTSEIDLTYRLARLPPPYFFTCCAVRSGAGRRKQRDCYSGHRAGSQYHSWRMGVAGGQGEEGGKGMG